MTLIASLTLGGEPVLISDRLLTTPNTGSEDPIPTINRKHSLLKLDDDYQFIGICSKYMIVNKTLVVGWAGNFASANRILQAIEQSAATISDRIEFLEQFLIANHREDFEKVRLIMHQFEGNNVYHAWSNFSRNIGRAGIELSCIGSAGDDLRSLFDQLPFDSLIKDRSGSHASIVALGMTGLLLANELLTGKPTQSRYGGFYDIVVIDPSGPRLLSNVTYVFAQVFKNEDDISIGLPFKVINSSLLPSGRDYITSFNIERQSAGNNERTNLNQFFQTDEDISFYKYNSLEPNLNSEWVVMVYAHYTSEKNFRIKSQCIRISDERLRPIKFDPRGATMDINYNFPIIREEINTFIDSIYGNDPCVSD